MIKWLLVVMACVCTWPAWAVPTVLQDVRVSDSHASTRFVFEFNQKPHYRISSLSQPRRLVLDFSDADWHGSWPHLPVGDGQIQAIRFGKHDDHVRVVLDLKQAVASHDFILPPMATSMFRMVLDLTPTGKNGEMRSNAVGSSELAMPTPTLINTLTQQRRDVVVVIDPGHGGKDPGASGLWGTHEKDVVLGIAKALQEDLNQRPGFKAVLTRDKDIFLPLRQRLVVARSYQPDLFISIHADAFKLRSAAGASVYALSEHGASNEAAEWLANSENATELMGGVSLDDKGDILRSVLLDLSQNATIVASLDLGKRLLKHLKGVTRLHRSKVDQASFVVLKSPDIPSVLVETGFLSNPREEERLRDPAHQHKFANAMATGIVEYFREHAPKGSYFAWLSRRSKQRYQVQAGDTLSEIARDFGCSLSTLSKANQGASHHLNVGQVLWVPKCKSLL